MYENNCSCKELKAKGVPSSAIKHTKECNRYFVYMTTLTALMKRCHCDCEAKKAVAEAELATDIIMSRLK